MSEHTLGPWIVSMTLRDPGCIIIHDKQGRSIASCWNLMGPHGEEPNTPMEANARLIAASPDLLAACQAFVEAHEPCTAQPRFIDSVGLHEAFAEAKAAIAKATGADTQ